MGQDLDFFPADVTVDGVEHKTCRVVAADGLAFVFGAQFGQPVIFAQGDLPGGWEPSGLPYRLTIDGQTWVVTQSPGCGCSHPLKRLRGHQLLAMLAPQPQPAAQ